LHSKTVSGIIDALVFNIYFPDHMNEREIDVLEFVELDIEKALQGREFDSLSDARKRKGHRATPCHLEPSG
jgi:hypothetical protein